MRHFPVFMNLCNRPVLLIGTGEAAAAKARLLMSAGADLHLAPMGAPLEPVLRDVCGQSVSVSEATLESLDPAGYVCVVTACGDDRDDAVARRMVGTGIPFNAVDRPDLSNFIVPAIVDRDDVVVAIGTGGAAPVLARRLRERIERVVPQSIGLLARFIARNRDAIASWSVSARRQFWEKVVDGPIGAAVQAGRLNEAVSGLESMRSDFGRLGVGGSGQPGHVSLVGAGPGDPDLLTVKALRALQDADVVLYDDLVTEPILNRARRDARLIFVGKRAGAPGLGQQGIHRLMIEQAGKGNKVVRLKGGDPFIFGRGGEEVEALREAGIAFDVVPGITAAAGCSADLELPLTHRDLAARLVTVSAHRRRDAEAVDWSPMAQDDTTVAVYMGRAAAPVVSSGLIRSGRSPQTPVAVVASGTRPDGVVHVGTLQQLPALAALTAATPRAPVLFIIGDVVRLSRPWLENETRNQQGRAVAVGQ